MFERLFTECDVDGSGTIDKEEMTLFIQNVTPGFDWSKIISQKL